MNAPTVAVQPTSVGVDASSHIFITDPPPISAIYLARFDHKVGYTVSWKRSLPEISLEAGDPFTTAVEFKSFPSGSHKVETDLVYFLHEDYAGVSAFERTPASEEVRNALFISVGVLVPLADGRLGRSWLHARAVQELARHLSQNPDDTSRLDEYATKHLGHAATIAPSIHSPLMITPAKENPLPHVLPPAHPILGMMRYIDAFGPLLFLIHRAALLRRRILIIGESPVQNLCEFVYIISVLSSVPSETDDWLPDTVSPATLRPLRPLFNISLADLSLLENTTTDEDVSYKGWVASTTDEVLAYKPELWDILIQMPKRASRTVARRRWPTIKTAARVELKVNQRDFRRFKSLYKSLHPVRSLIQHSSVGSQETLYSDGPDNVIPMFGTPSPHRAAPGYDPLIFFEAEELIEPETWAALAYRSFMWWATAGEQESAMRRNELQDFRLFSPVVEAVTAMYSARDIDGPLPTTAEIEALVYTNIIGVFHRFTKTIIFFGVAVCNQSASHTSHLTTDHVPSSAVGATHSSSIELNDACPRFRSGRSHGRRRSSVTHKSAINAGMSQLSPPSSDQSSTRPAKTTVYMTSDHIARMGLDPWSSSDEEFIRDFMMVWFGMTLGESRMSAWELFGIRLRLF